MATRYLAEREFRVVGFCTVKKIARTDSLTGIDAGTFLYFQSRNSQWLKPYMTGTAFPSAASSDALGGRIARRAITNPATAKPAPTRNPTSHP